MHVCNFILNHCWSDIKSVVFEYFSFIECNPYPSVDVVFGFCCGALSFFDVIHAKVVSSFRKIFLTSDGRFGLTRISPPHLP